MTTDEALTEQVAEAVRQALSDGEALQCTRVWEAWLYKTMTDEDFTDASDGPLVEDVTAAVLPIVRKAQADALRDAVEVAAVSIPDRDCGPRAAVTVEDLMELASEIQETD